MSKKQIILIVVAFVAAAFIFWFKVNYTIIKKPDQTERPQSSVSELFEVGELPGPTTQPGLDPVAESRGPAYPPPSTR